MRLLRNHVLLKLIALLRVCTKLLKSRLFGVVKYLIDSTLLCVACIYLVCIAVFLKLNEASYLIGICLVISSVFLFLLVKTKQIRLVIFVIVVLIAAYRVVETKSADTTIQSAAAKLVGDNVDIKGYIYSEPEWLHDNQKFVFRITQLNGQIVDAENDVLVKTTKDVRYVIGQKCFLKGDVKIPKSSNDFDYAQYLLMRRIGLTIDMPIVECEGLSNRAGNMAQNALIDFKNALIAQIDLSLPEPQAGLLAGIVFGQKRTFDREFEEYVRNAGVAHVVAASGYNISFVVIGVEKLLFWLSRKYRLGGMILAAWIYTLIAGFSASIVRAAIMSTFSLAASLLGSKSFVHEAIPISAFIFAVINPYIIYDVGFLLSLAATLGLVYLVPVFQRFKLGQIAEPLACLVATMPITVAVFGTFSVVSLAANLVIGVLLDYAMIVGVVGVFVQLLISAVGSAILLVSWAQLKIFEIVISFFGSMTFSSLNIDVVASKDIVFILLVAIVIIFVLLVFPKSENYRFNYYFSNG